MRFLTSLLVLVGALLQGCGTDVSGGQGFGAAGVVYIADGRQAGVFELWAAEADGGDPVVISGPLVATADVSAFAWSPSRTHVAFAADRDTDGQTELYCVDLSNGALTKVSGTMIANGDLDDDFAWSDDSQYIAYRADANVTVKMELFVTTPTGGADRVSSAAMDDNGGVQDFAWQPGGTRLAFMADNAGTGAFRISLVSEDGSGLQQLNSAGPQSQYTWAPDGSRLAWLDDSLNNGRVGLYSIDENALGLQDLSDLLLATNATAEVLSYDWRQDGGKLAFVVDRDVDARYEAWSVDAVGTNLLKIVTAAGGTDVLDLAYSPAGAFLVAYRIDDAVTDVPELHVVFDSGIGETTLVEDDGVDGVTSWDWSPDGNRIAYLADHNVNDAPDLWNVVVLGGPNVIDVMSSMGAGEQVFEFEWAPDASRILFTSDDDAPAFGIRDLFRATVDGTIARLTTNTSAANDVERFGWSTDSQRTGWIDGLTLLDPMHLFLADQNGNAQVNATLPLDPPLTDTTLFSLR